MWSSLTHVETKCVNLSSICQSRSVLVFFRQQLARQLLFLLSNINYCPRDYPPKQKQKQEQHWDSNGVQMVSDRSTYYTRRRRRIRAHLVSVINLMVYYVFGQIWMGLHEGCPCQSLIVCFSPPHSTHLAIEWTTASST